MDFDSFLYAYIEAALWSSVDEDGEPIDDNYNIENMSVGLLASMTDDCRVFWDRNGPYIQACHDPHARSEWSTYEQAGHDFWLTRNGHGDGFWDGRHIWGPYTHRFTEDSKRFGVHDITVEDGEVISM